MGKYHSEIPPLYGHRLSKTVAPIGTQLDADDTVAAELADATRGKFDIIGVLGRGDLASVYLAIDVSLRRQVAIKVFALATNESDEAAADFRREAKILGSLNHPHIVPVYRITQVGRLVYFVMRYIDGRGLDVITRHHGTLPVDVTRLIVGEVADGLDLSHEYGILHRDVKPANIIVGRDGLPNVTDFGLGHLSNVLTKTIAGKVFDLPYYMSPEDCTDEDVSEASDQYSLAAVAYEMLAGRPPFDGSTFDELARAHVSDAPPALGDLRSGLPPALCAAVHRALNKNPDDRWPTIAAFAMAMASDVMVNREVVRATIAAVVEATPAEEAPRPASQPASAADPEKRKQKKPRRRRDRRRAEKLRTALSLVLIASIVAGAIFVPRFMRQRAASREVAERIAATIAADPNGQRTTRAGTTARMADRRPATSATAAAPVAEPPKALSSPAACGSVPTHSTLDLSRRGRAIIRLCFTVDHTSVTIGDVPFGSTASGVREVEVDAGTISYVAQRDECQPRGATIALIAGEFRVIPAKKANPFCDAPAPTKRP